MTWPNIGPVAEPNAVAPANLQLAGALLTVEVPSIGSTKRLQDTMVFLPSKTAACGWPPFLTANPATAFSRLSLPMQKRWRASQNRRLLVPSM